MKAAKLWIDENGLQIPTSRITPAEKLKERTATKLFNKASDINSRLVALKADFDELTEKIILEVMAENNIDNAKPRKGNFSFYNFDRSIKIELDMQERIEFDDALIMVAKEHFDNFLDNGSGGIDEMIKTLIKDAFNTSKGKLDTKKVLSLVKHRTRIPAKKYPEFHNAIDAIEKSINRPSSKKYYRISVLNDVGKYEPIQLNFSAI